MKFAWRRPGGGRGCEWHDIYLYGHFDIGAMFISIINILIQ